MITYGTNPGMGLEFLKAYPAQRCCRREETYKNL
jgi:hypothetical protein